jgi:hypothetical protein
MAKNMPELRKFITNESKLNYFLKYVLIGELHALSILSLNSFQ